jgi:hypothetical protein
MTKEKNSLMKTECAAGQLEFLGLGRRAVVCQLHILTKIRAVAGAVRNAG